MFASRQIRVPPPPAYLTTGDSLPTSKPHASKARAPNELLYEEFTPARDQRPGAPGAPASSFAAMADGVAEDGA